MNQEDIDEMIKCQGVYEIRYKKDGKVTVWHISNIDFSPEYNKFCISAYCQEVEKELTFNVRKIISIKKYWINFVPEDASAPCDGVFLIARMIPGMGGGVDYQVYALKKGDSLMRKDHPYSLPFAYHYLHFFGEYEGEWIKKEIAMKKWEYEEIPAPEDGIPIIAFRKNQGEADSKESLPVEYCLGNGNGHEDSRQGQVWGGVSKDQDISTFFKDEDSAGYTWWSEKWSGYKILGFLMVSEYNRWACPQHVKQWLTTM